MTTEFLKPVPAKEVDPTWVPVEGELPTHRSFGYVFSLNRRNAETGIPVVFPAYFIIFPFNKGGFIYSEVLIKIEGSESWEFLSHYDFWQEGSQSFLPCPFKEMS